MQLRLSNYLLEPLLGNARYIRAGNGISSVRWGEQAGGCVNHIAENPLAVQNAWNLARAFKAKNYTR
jgi:hypothetical protein